MATKTKELSEVPKSNPVPAEESSELVVASNGQLQDGSLDDLMQEDAGAGFSNMGANDFAIPFLAILQKNSPQVSKANAKYVKGAAAGMFYNTLTQEIYEGEEVGVQFIPCGYSKLLVEWKPRDSGGGLVAQHREGDPIIKKCHRDERGRLVVPTGLAGYEERAGNIIVDTAYHFGLLLHDDGAPEWIVASMYSTALKASRTWNTTMRRILVDGPKGKYNPPMYGYIYRLKTVGQTKDTYDWYTWSITPEKKVNDFGTYKTAREFSKQVEAGAVRVSAPPQDFDESVATDEVPF